MCFTIFIISGLKQFCIARAKCLNRPAPSRCLEHLRASSPLFHCASPTASHHVCSCLTRLDQFFVKEIWSRIYIIHCPFTCTFQNKKSYRLMAFGWICSFGTLGRRSSGLYKMDHLSLCRPHNLRNKAFWRCICIRAGQQQSNCSMNLESPPPTKKMHFCMKKKKWTHVQKLDFTSRDLARCRLVCSFHRRYKFCQRISIHAHKLDSPRSIVSKQLLRSTTHNHVKFKMLETSRICRHHRRSVTSFRSCELRSTHNRSKKSWTSALILLSRQKIRLLTVKHKHIWIKSKW